MAHKLHTHYDNLKVSPNAPVEVIRAAYKAMAQKHHPDRNAEEGAQQVMQGLNESWDVLSDPVQRAAHDAWIAEQEMARLADDAAASSAPGPVPPPARRRRRRKTGLARRWVPLASLSIFVGVSTFCVAVFSELSENAVPAVASTRSGSVARSTTPVPAPPAVEMAASAVSGDVLQHQRTQRALLDYGQALPDSSGAIIGARQTPGSGPVGLTIENPHTAAPVVAKLCHAVWSHCWALQHVYIEPGRTLTLNKLSPGKYDVRHVNLDSGLIYRSGMFEVPEAGKEKVAHQPALALTLREPADGRSGATRIDLHQF